jgi:hypothetical protein
MAATIICKEMGWTWQEYEAQPITFIDTIVEMLKAETREVEKRNKKSWPNQQAN